MTDIFNIPAPTWMHDPTRNCAMPAGLDPKTIGIVADDWHPAGKRERAARTLCGGCPVQMECLRYALANESLSGVWGGTTTSERVKLRGGANNCGTYAGYLRHQKRGEKACRRCSMANAQASRQKRAAAKRAAADAA